ncbi:uncharacterized protein LOC128932627 [Callithrix jacchus]
MASPEQLHSESSGREESRTGDGKGLGERKGRRVARTEGSPVRKLHRPRSPTLPPLLQDCGPPPPPPTCPGPPRKPVGVSSAAWLARRPRLVSGPRAVPGRRRGGSGRRGGRRGGVREPGHTRLARPSPAGPCRPETTRRGRTPRAARGGAAPACGDVAASNGAYLRSSLPGAGWVKTHGVNGPRLCCSYTGRLPIPTGQALFFSDLELLCFWFPWPGTLSLLSTLPLLPTPQCFTSQ